MEEMQSKQWGGVVFFFCYQAIWGYFKIQGCVHNNMLRKNNLENGK